MVGLTLVFGSIAPQTPIPGGFNTQRAQVRLQLAPHAPHLAQRRVLEQRRLLLGPRGHHHPALAAPLGGPIGQLCEGFRCADADPHRHARQALHLRANVPPVASQRPAQPGQVEKALVDRIHLKPRRQLAQHPHHPGGNVTVQRIIAAECQHAVRLHQVADLEERLAHSNAQRLGLVAAAHHTAVVASE
ncbi:hypothetical protein ASF15_25215 [Pseudomonas sp. Leaf83]|nr:hypothetical protein ASF15_25215 [Pseudomonas sp. Leaf83]